MTSRVAILCARMEDELPALLGAFGFETHASPNTKAYDLPCWHRHIEGKAGTPTEVLISCIAVSDGIDAQLPTERMVRSFVPDLAIFVGIARGLRPLRLGDIVTCGALFGYDYLKTLEGRLDFGRAFSVPKMVHHEASRFADSAAWYDLFNRLGTDIPPPKRPRYWRQAPQHHQVPIVSGEKAMNPGELALLHKKHAVVEAADEESVAFAAACGKQDVSIPWMVVRGIAEHDDDVTDEGAKDDLGRDEYHYAAALAAATWTRVFLGTSYSGRSNARNAAGIPQLRETFVSPSIYVASPMASFSTENEYQRERGEALAFTDVLQEIGFRSVYYAGRHLKTREWEADGPAFVRNLAALKQADQFVLLYPAQVASGSLVETGMAIERGIKTVIFVRSRDDLPFVLRRASEVLGHVKWYAAPTAEAAIEMIREYRKEIFGDFEAR